ncbi:hypothetical protein IMZ48_47310 [Candidatus Bathyarchaeota archaeon]|nr:hypothetical protein [Candidatus Bathyarchaeota archaeon]
MGDFGEAMGDLGEAIGDFGLPTGEPTGGDLSLLSMAGNEEDAEEEGTRAGDNNCWTLYTCTEN